MLSSLSVDSSFVIQFIFKIRKFVAKFNTCIKCCLVENKVANAITQKIKNINFDEIYLKINLWIRHGVRYD